MAQKKTKQAQTASSIPVIAPKKKRDKRKLNDDDIERLEQLFFMGGVTVYQASRQTGIHFETVRAYFTAWAEQLVDDPEHEPWIVKEKKARARALESVTKQIMPVKSNLSHFEKLLASLLYHRQGDTVVPNQEVNMEAVERMEKIVRLNRILLAELQQQYAAIDMMLPAEAIIERELEVYIAQKQNLPAEPEKG